MADDKQGRDKQAQDQDRRQRQRALKEELERWGETEPIDAALQDLELMVETYEYPATPEELHEEFGDETIETEQGPLTVGDVFGEEPDRTYESATEVRELIRESVIDEE